MINHRAILPILLLIFVLVPATWAQETSPPPETAAPEAGEESSTLRTHVPDPLREVGFLFEHWQWLGLLLLAIGAILVDRLIAVLLQRLIEGQLAPRIRELEQGELRRALRPVGLLAAALVCWPALSWLALPEPTLNVLVTAIKFIAATTTVWAAYRTVDVVSVALEARAAETQNKLDDLLVPLVRKSLKVFIVAIGLIFIADNLNVPISSLLAGVGIGGLAVALAAQDAVRNLFGSLMVIADRPFHVGDWVVIGDVEGTVEEVGFRTTRIRTFYNSVISLPNSNLITASVDNLGVRQYRRWSTKLGLACNTPSDKVEAFCEGVRELIRRHPYTRKDYFHVYFNEFTPSTLSVMLYVFFQTPDWGTELRERHRLGLDILRLAAELGVELAFPTQTLFLHRPEEPPAPLPREGYGKRLDGAHEDARQLARNLVHGALEGQTPPPVDPLEGLDLPDEAKAGS